MSFTQTQIALLDAKLDGGSVKSRKQAGRQFSYLEGWFVISEANRIFGFDGWTKETVETRLVSEKPRKIGEAGRDGWGVTYVAKVRVTVHAGDRTIVREGVGAGHGIDADLGLAHESAIKEAETDSYKRAMTSFGNSFGLALYDKAQEGVEKPNGLTRPPPPQKEPTVNIVPNAAELAYNSLAIQINSAQSLAELIITKNDLEFIKKFNSLNAEYRRKIREQGEKKQASFGE